MKSISFGVEVEVIGQTRKVVATAIQSVVGGTVEHVGTPYCYDPWDVIAADGRRWRVVADSSLSAAKEYQAEIVSPILHYDDIETMQKVVRAVRRTGARCDASCGQHVHLSKACFTPKSICNLVKMINKQEQLIEHALGISEARKSRWCRGIDQSFLERLERRRPQSMDDLNRAWYGYFNDRPEHYHSSRYRGLNLHNLWYGQTLEFRHFEGSLHAGKVKAYIQFALALGAKAIKAKAASSKRREFNPATAKYDFRVWLLSLGMLGDEFKTARLHLLANCQGSAAWKGERRDTAVYLQRHGR